MKRDDLVKAPTTPLLITGIENDGKVLRVATFNRETRQLEEFGPVRVDSSLVGRTIMNYDWSRVTGRSEGEGPR